VTSLDDRLRTLLDVASPALEPDRLARFLDEPHALLGNRRPWDLLTDCHQSEFERIMEVVQNLAESAKEYASPRARISNPPGGREQINVAPQAHFRDTGAKQ
jgi:hypothetical protein